MNIARKQNLKNKEINNESSSLPGSPCLSSPCLNSGVCISLLDDTGLQRGYKCKCSNPQDSGIYCEDRNFVITLFSLFF